MRSAPAGAWLPPGTSSGARVRSCPGNSGSCTVPVEAPAAPKPPAPGLQQDFRFRVNAADVESVEVTLRENLVVHRTRPPKEEEEKGKGKGGGK